MLQYFILSTYPGSPPRVREGLKSVALNPYGIGITPACAGRTQHGYRVTVI